MPKSTPPKRSSKQSPRAAPSSRTDQKNEGEGNRTAARRYNQAVEKTVKSGVVPEKARAAARALEGPEGGELRRAEAQAKRGKNASEQHSQSK